MFIICERPDNRRREERTFVGVIESIFYASTVTRSDVPKVKNAIAECAYHIMET